MKAPQAWRIYHGDAMNKTELTTSPTRVAKAKEQGFRVVEMVEKVERTLDQAYKDATELFSTEHKIKQ